MKHLVIYAHPSKDSLNYSIQETVVNQLRLNHHEIEVRDLYKIGFNPVTTMDDMSGWHTGIVSPDVKKEQEYILWADVITFIYPIWWAGLPAMMKGYIDRVFSFGFAFNYVKGVRQGLLKGKKTVIINTQGKSKEEYAWIGMDTALKVTSDTCIFEYCDLKVEDHIFFASAMMANSKTVEDWLKEVKAIKSFI